MKESNISPVKIIMIALLLFSLLYCFVTLFIFDIMIVRGHSMEPTFSQGDIIFVNKLAYGLLIPFKNEYITTWGYPKHGDIVLFRDPEEGKKTVKRCIAVQNDPIEYRDSKLYIAGNHLPFNPLQHYTLDIHLTEVPDHTIFVLGDNPAHSIDSRHFGYIQVTHILGKVIFN